MFFLFMFHDDEVLANLDLKDWAPCVGLAWTSYIECVLMSLVCELYVVFGILCLRAPVHLL